MTDILPDAFRGFDRGAGAPGVRNRLLILSVCGLNAPQARKVAAALPGAALVSTGYGRGQLGPDAVFHDTMLTGFACHPNVGAVLVLAPDTGLRARFQEAAAAAGRRVEGLSLPECGEDAERLVSRAVELGQSLARALEGDSRSDCPTSALCLATECGHSDASSGIIANPLVGDLVDLLTGHGGKAILAETMEWTGLEQALQERCASGRVAAELEALITARQALATRLGHDVTLGNPGPQNHAGGLTTLEEKSVGSVAKGGTGPIVGALRQGQTPDAGPGLYLMDTPTLSPESISSMVAAGAQIALFTTGAGNPYGSALAPTIKLTANPATARRLTRQIDFDASAAFAGTTAREALVAPLARLMIEVAEGRVTWAERLGECDEVISRLEPSI